MTGKYTLYFWEPMLSPHKLPLFGALQCSSRVKSVTQIAGGELPSALRDLGWSVTLPENVETIVAPTMQEIERIVENAPADAIHVFSGIRWCKTITKGLARAIESNRHYGLMSEPRATQGAMGRLRFLHSLLTERQIRSSADFVLAIGRDGPPWYRSVGYSPDRIFPYAYFLSHSQNSIAHDCSRESDGVVRIVFVGRLSRTKGIHIVLQSLPFLPSAAQVFIFGAGPEEHEMRKTAGDEKSALTIRGVVPNNEIPSILDKMDILILPSTTKDGWGAVVSEALLAGAAVIASDCVGASICLDNDVRGRILKNLGGIDVANEVKWLMDNDRLSREYRKQRQMWARDRLTGQAGADHLIKILDHIYHGFPRPMPFYC